MKWLKLTFIASLAILFVATSFLAIFSGGRILGQIFKTYVFKYETCEYKLRPIPLKELQAEPEESSRECYIDHNRAKKDIAEGLAMLIVSLPVVYLTQQHLRKEIKENVEQ